METSQMDYDLKYEKYQKQIKSLGYKAISGVKFFSYFNFSSVSGYGRKDKHTEVTLKVLVSLCKDFLKIS